MTRGGLEQRIKQRLTEAGAVWVSKINSGKIVTKGRAIQLAPAGTPDLLAFFAGGVAIWCEIKDTDDKLAPHQIDTCNALAEAGHYVLIVAADPVPAKDLARLSAAVMVVDEGSFLLTLGGLL